MYKGKRQVIPRSESWGYSDEPLQEQWVIRCRTDSNLTSAAS